MDIERIHNLHYISLFKSRITIRVEKLLIRNFDQRASELYKNKPENVGNKMK